MARHVVVVHVFTQQIAELLAVDVIDEYHAAIYTSLRDMQRDPGSSRRGRRGMSPASHADTG